MACAASPDIPRMSRAVTLPLYHLGSPHRFVRAEVNGRSWYFLLDTGAKESAVTPRAANEMGLSTRFGTPLEGIGGSAEADTAELPRLSLGPIAVKRFPVRVVELSTSFFHQNPDLVAGYLGSDFLRRFHLGLDLAAGTLTLGAPGGAPFFTGEPTRIPVSPGDEILVPVTVNGERHLFELDTGADLLLMFRAHTALRGAPTALSLGGVGPGAQVEAELLRVSSLGLGALSLAGLDALIVDLPRKKSGLLGALALSRLRVEYDPERSELLFWERPLLAETGALDARPPAPKPKAGPPTVIDAGDVDVEIR